jgi:SAM-dependent methyltransferase
VLNEEDFYGERWLRPLVELKVMRRSDCPSISLVEVAASGDMSQSRVAEAWLDSCMRTSVRKYWEFSQGVYALEELGLLHNGSNALGVGSGHEHIVFYLATLLGHVTATDLYDMPGGWHGREGDPSMLTAPEQYIAHILPAHTWRERLTMLAMDGTRLQFPDASFDVVFSFSAIEHFYYLWPWPWPWSRAQQPPLNNANGNTNANGKRTTGFLPAATDSVVEMARVLRPGGALVLATEVILNGRPHFDWLGGVVPMRNFFLPEDLQTYIIEPAAAAGLHLVEPIDWTVSDRTLQHVVQSTHNSEQCRAARPHFLLQEGGLGAGAAGGLGPVWTSISLAFQKK